MNEIRIVQIGLGPLGRKMVQFASARSNMSVVAAVDTDPSLAGRNLAELTGVCEAELRVSASLAEALESSRPDIALLTTVSDIKRIAPQLEEILAHRLPVVSTCEELVFPWHTAPGPARRVDELARRAGVAVLGTGVNPGFLMDALPICLTALCQRVEAVKVSRIQDASVRRVPFQRKIGAGLTLAEFERKKLTGTLRHVGLTESMHLIGARMGWTVERTEDVLSPVVAEHTVHSGGVIVEAGAVAGVQQIGRGYVGGTERITLVFRASVGEAHPEDRIEITGEPNVVSSIAGGVHGDIATCAISLNALERVLRAEPGLRTMADIPVVTFSGAGR
jgi:hypothetical protein